MEAARGDLLPRAGAGPSRGVRRFAFVGVLVVLSGAAALSWEVLWQIHASLAIGLSARGTALTLIATMGGLTLGSLACGRLMPAWARERPGRAYAALEIVVGLAGCLGLAPGFQLVERVDSALYLRHPVLSPALELAGILVVLGVPAAAMGATVPVLGLMARRLRTSIAVLYGLNTAGAAIGVVAVTFYLLPALGVQVTSVLLACINLSVAALAATMGLPEATVDAEEEPHAPRGEVTRSGLGVVLVSGFVTLGLEVAWFRALRAAFWSTTESLAIMLTAVLLPLALGAEIARRLGRRGASVGVALGAGGVAVLVATPLIERFDGLFLGYAAGHATVTLARLAASLVVVGPAVALLGTCLPWVLSRRAVSAGWGRVYATNTLGAVLGSLAVAWVALPTLGSERTAWVLGGVAILTSLAVTTGRSRSNVALVAVPAFVVACLCDSGAGRARIQGAFPNRLVRNLAIEEGPDATVAVADDALGDRVLAIDGFSATTQGVGTHYMRWMGRLPILLSDHPDRALVICFGTGQTANAVREEGPRDLDVVELDPAVFRMAHYFDSNHDVLADPRVHPVTMDGRAWLRRADRTYDVVTLEPMPPNFAGVNALYSREFYDLVAARLRPGGIATQWLPFHLLSVETAAAIVATFQAAFGDAILWVDPVDFSGILVGRVGAPSSSFGRVWPGLLRPGPARDMSPPQIQQAVRLLPGEVARWARAGTPITDDNQLLAYDVHRGHPQGTSEALLLAHAAILARLIGDRRE